MTIETCTRRFGIEEDLDAKMKKRDKRIWEGKKNRKAADGNRKMEGCGGWRICEDGQYRAEAGAADGRMANFL